MHRDASRTTCADVNHKGACPHQCVYRRPRFTGVQVTSRGCAEEKQAMEALRACGASAPARDPGTSTDLVTQQKPTQSRWCHPSPLLPAAPTNWRPEPRRGRHAGPGGRALPDVILRSGPGRVACYSSTHAVRPGNRMGSIRHSVFQNGPSVHVTFPIGWHDRLRGYTPLPTGANFARRVPGAAPRDEPSGHPPWSPGRSAPQLRSGVPLARRRCARYRMGDGVARQVARRAVDGSDGSPRRRHKGA